MDVREYDLNLIPGSVPQIIKINQYDKGIPFQFTIYQGDKKFSIPSGAIVALSGTKPDGLGFHYACTFSGSTVSVTIGDQVAVLSGNVRAELTITSGDSVRLGTANFTFCVEPAALKDDTAVSDSDFPEIIKAANNIGAAQKSADAAAKSAQDAKNSAASAASAASNAISGEVTRAKAAEKANADAITAETTRAKAAEKANADAVSAEAARAKAAEKTNADAVSAEAARAKAAEKTNADAIKTKMTTATYDANGNGIVDNAEKVGGHTVLKDVPSNAVFTDHIYDDTAVKQSVTDLQTNLTNGSLKVGKAASADTASTLGRIGTAHFAIPDNGGRLKYLVLFDITDWRLALKQSPTRAFDGYFFARRGDGFCGTNASGAFSIVASWNGKNSDGSFVKSDNGASLRLRTTCSIYVPCMVHNKTTDHYFLAMKTSGSGRDLYLFGIFQGTLIGTWIECSGDGSGKLPDEYEEYNVGYYVTPEERAVADKNGNDIANTYIKNLSVSGNTITFTRGNGTTGSITVGS